MADPSRAQRRHAARRRRGGLQVAVALMAIVALALIVVFTAAGGSLGSSGAATPQPTDTTSPPPPITLVAGTSGKGEGKLVWLDLLSRSDDGGKGSIVYIPAHSAVEVPGRGLQDLSDAYATGGMSLLLSSAENLLGVRILITSSSPIATRIRCSRRSTHCPWRCRTRWRPRSARTERACCSVPGSRARRPPYMTSLLYTVGLGGDDQELGNRNLAFWDALNGAYGSDPFSLVSRLLSAGAPVESNTSFRDDARLIAQIISLPSSERTLAPLPVDQVSVGGGEMYRSDSGRIASFLTQAIGSVPPPDEAASLQVLNGNGVPGIGERVSGTLINHGFRVVLSGNAPNFPNYKHSLIVMYGTSKRERDLAHQIKEVLGVGQIEVSAQRQGIVDLTIVVGKDFLGKH